MSICNKLKWEPSFWNELPKKTIKSTNCYSYAMNQINKGNKYDGKVQPGTCPRTKELNKLVINKDNKYKETTCDEIIKKVKEDYQWASITKCKLKDKLPCNRYRIALVIDNDGEHIDYHFYRQDNNGKWSHKLGVNPITNKDACDEYIFDPKEACRNYDKKNNDKYNYSVFCGYYSVPFHEKDFLE